MTTFTKGQKVNHNGETFLFGQVSHRGGNGEWAFIYEVNRTTNGKQVKVSDLEPCK